MPDDLSLVGIRDTWAARLQQPALTVVPLRAAGAQAATMLLQHLEGAPLADLVVNNPPPELVSTIDRAATTLRIAPSWVEQFRTAPLWPGRHGCGVRPDRAD